MIKPALLALAASLSLSGCVEGNPALPDPGLTIDPSSITVPTVTTSLVPPADIQ